LLAQQHGGYQEQFCRQAREGLSELVGDVGVRDAAQGAFTGFWHKAAESLVDRALGLLSASRWLPGG